MRRFRKLNAKNAENYFSTFLCAAPDALANFIQALSKTTNASEIVPGIEGFQSATKLVINQMRASAPSNFSKGFQSSLELESWLTKNRRWDPSPTAKTPIWDQLDLRQQSQLFEREKVPPETLELLNGFAYFFAECKLADAPNAYWDIWQERSRLQFHPIIMGYEVPIDPTSIARAIVREFYFYPESFVSDTFEEMYHNAGVKAAKSCIRPPKSIRSLLDANANEIKEGVAAFLPSKAKTLKSERFDPEFMITPSESRNSTFVITVSSEFAANHDALLDQLPTHLLEQVDIEYAVREDREVFNVHTDISKAALQSLLNDYISSSTC